MHYASLRGHDGNARGSVAPQAGGCRFECDIPLQSIAGCWAVEEAGVVARDTEEGVTIVGRLKNPRRQVMKQVRSLVVLATLCCTGLPVYAQQAPPPAAEPGWAK